MCTSENSDFCADDPQEAEFTPAETFAEVTTKAPVHRRTFLKAAALGTAAAAVVGKTTSFGPLTALADDLSTFQCTAGDVEIIGAGQVINEPCTCTGTFNAQVQFTVRNNASSPRGCITLHLVPNSVFSSQVDVLLQGEIAGKTTQTMTGVIQNYPCGAGLQCFGSASGNGRGRCAAGECSTVSWTVPGQDTCPPAKQISSKCRHQQICIQGRGNTTVDCDLSTTGGQSSCEVACGGDATVRVCTTNASSLGPFTFTLDGQSFGPTTDTCHDFTVSGVSTNTTLTATVTDKDGCAKSATVNLTVTEITPAITIRGANGCGGLLTLTAAAEGFSGCSVVWSIDGTEAADTESDALIVRLNSDGTLTYRNLDGACHTVGAALTCGSCTGSTSRTISQCVGTTANCS
jgi:hypothetical protein